MRHHVIHIHAAAPVKPAPGGACNGCGVCCAIEPCPIGQWISRRRTGACKALQWHDDEARYRCGFVVAPGRFVPWMPAAVARKLALRWIASGLGCDATLSVEPTGDAVDGS